MNIPLERLYLKIYVRPTLSDSVLILDKKILTVYVTSNAGTEELEHNCNGSEKV